MIKKDIDKDYDKNKRFVQYRYRTVLYEQNDYPKRFLYILRNTITRTRFKIIRLQLIR